MFKSNTLYADASKNWQFSNTDYKFKYSGANVHIRINNVDLICHGPDDSLIVRETSGKYNILTNQWVGSKGLIDWERVGISAVKAFAEFDKYEIDMTTPGLKIDTVQFQYAGVLDGKILGKLEDKVSARTIHRKGDNFNDSGIQNLYPLVMILTLKALSLATLCLKADLPWMVASNAG